MMIFKWTANNYFSMNDVQAINNLFLDVLCFSIKNINKDLITLNERSVNATGRAFVHNFDSTLLERSENIHF